MYFIKFGNYLSGNKIFLKFAGQLIIKHFKQNLRLKKNLNQVTGSNTAHNTVIETVQEPKPTSNGKEGSS